MATPKITVREPRYGAVVLNYGQPGINQCRARVVQPGLNYNAIAAGEISAVALRDANRPLFDLALPPAPSHHHQGPQL